MSASTKQKEHCRQQRLARAPKSIEAVLALCASIEASLPTLPPALQEYVSRVRQWAIARRDERIAQSMGLVGKMVHCKYRAPLSTARVSFDDAMQEGTMGLMRAAELYDESRGVQFSTYASNWIQNRISILLDSASLIHAPRYLFGEKDKRQPKGRRKAEFKEAAEKSRAVFSLTTYFRPNNNGEQSAEGVVEEPRASVHPERIDANIDLEPLLKALHPRHRLVIELRFLRGLSLDEVGAELAKTLGEKRVTRERVRQMVAQGLHRMRKAAMQR